MSTNDKDIMNTTYIFNDIRLVSELAIRFSDIIENGSYEEIQPLLVPFLAERKKFQHAYYDDTIYKELLMEELLEKGYSRKKCEKICRIMTSEYVTMDWNGFCLAYLLDWTNLEKEYMYASLAAGQPSFLTVGKLEEMGVKRETILEDALKNLSEKKIIRGKAFSTDPLLKDLEIFVIHTQYNYNAEMSVLCSVLLLNGLLKEIYQTLKEPYYIFPLYRDAIFYIPRSELALHKYNPRTVLIKLSETTQKNQHEIFTKHIFSYDSNKLTLI